MTSDDACSLKSSECGEYVQVLVSRKSLICILYFLCHLEVEFLSFILIGCPRLLPQPFQRFFLSLCDMWKSACKTAVQKNCFSNPFSDFPKKWKEREFKNRYLGVEIRFRISRLVVNPKSGF